MPGTIQATVVEFKSNSSSSHPSHAQSLKVSMGKRHYHTRDNGDFSFPITKLGEDLVVVLVDAGGNETARTDIRLAQIIEKGYWDEVFSLDGGGADGQVHMKLQVILSVEERDRIRVMRESAVKKKKHETDPANTLRLTESTSLRRDMVSSTSFSEKISDSQNKVVVSPKVHVSKAGSSLNSTTPAVKPLNTNRKDAGIVGNIIPVKDFSVIQVKTESPRIFERIPDENIKVRPPFAIVRSEIMQRAVSMNSETTMPDNNSSAPRKSQDDLAHNRTPSNVRKMISAFEKSQVPEARRIRKSLSVPSQMYRAGNEGLLEVQDSSSGTEQAEQSSVNYEDQVGTENLHRGTSTVTSSADIVPCKNQQFQPPKDSESKVEPNPSRWKALCNYVSRPDPRGRMAEEPESLTSTLEKANRSMDEKQLQVVQANNSPLEQLDSVDSIVTGERETSFRSSWKEKIFSETETGPKHGSNQGPKHEMEKDQKKLPNAPEPGSGNFPHERLIGQVIKVVIVLGFGLLVLLNRQKEPRKKRRTENIDFFTMPDYIEEGTLIDDL